MEAEDDKTIHTGFWPRCFNRQFNVIVGSNIHFDYDNFCNVHREFGQKQAKFQFLRILTMCGGRIEHSSSGFQ